ncbi:hypothetical protein [Mangrovibacter phragmitis]|uniref:hypothetical protein n=1 Tax=Mangrovibacter phragmitis TaxID=1691903 RepID=UPI00336A8380
MTQKQHDAVCLCPGDMAPEEIPARVLEAIAGRAEGREIPLRIDGNSDRAGLAAQALWQYAGMTGLAQDGETVWTVMIDFLANMMHLAAELDMITPENSLFNDIVEAADFHYSAEDGSES